MTFNMGSSLFVVKEEIPADAVILSEKDFQTCKYIVECLDNENPKKISAIKTIRHITGLGLKDSKNLFDYLWENRPQYSSM